MTEIIIIDDEAIIRKGIRRMIELSGNHYEVIGEAENGEEGLRLILKKEPDIAIVDVKMPKMDGLLMIEYCLHQENLKTRFIILSAYDDYIYTRKSIKLGVCDYLLKPVNRLELIALLEELRKKISAGCVKTLTSVKEEDAESAIAAGIRYIEKHFYDDISLSCVAEKVRMHPNYFAVVFKKKTGVSYLDYLTNIRIKKAKELLTNPDLKVYEVSQMVGYYSPKYFSKLFKQHTGKTPNEWRCVVKS